MYADHKDLRKMIQELQRKYDYKINVHKILIQGIIETLDRITGE